MHLEAFLLINLAAALALFGLKASTRCVAIVFAVARSLLLLLLLPLLLGLAWDRRDEVWRFCCEWCASAVSACLASARLRGSYFEGVSRTGAAMSCAVSSSGSAEPTELRLESHTTSPEAAAALVQFVCAGEVAAAPLLAPAACHCAR